VPAAALSELRSLPNVAGVRPVVLPEALVHNGH
jgi:hypothetical protein